MKSTDINWLFGCLSINFSNFSQGKGRRSHRICPWKKPSFHKISNGSGPDLGKNSGMMMWSSHWHPIRLKNTLGKKQCLKKHLLLNLVFCLLAFHLSLQSFEVNFINILQPSLILLIILHASSPSCEVVEVRFKVSTRTSVEEPEIQSSVSADWLKKWKGVGW